MSLLDFPPHSVTRYASSNAVDSAAGHVTTYSAGQSGIPCSISTADASTVEKFAQAGQEVTHTIGIVAAVLTAAFRRGDKVIADDTSASFHVEGISLGRSYAGEPALLYLHCRELL